MKGRTKGALGALPLMVVANLALAAEPVQLTDQQMDGVTASGSAFADALAFSVGNPAATATAALARVAVVSSFASEVTRINLVQSDSMAQSASSANR